MVGQEDDWMKINQDKVDEMTLALLYLVMPLHQEGNGARAWKSFDWETMDRLHDQGWITDPKSKAKSVSVTEEGFQKAKAAFFMHFSMKE
jgi:hypothetical protein